MKSLVIYPVKWGVRLVACLALGVALVRCADAERQVIERNDFDSLKLGDFVEPDFPFISTILDARNLGDTYPKDNLVARGLAVQLGSDAYACFDTDLLRWSVGWTGPNLPMVLLPQVSYHDFFNWANGLPTIQGQPAFANGMYPGWSVNRMIHEDIRPARQAREGFHWGAIPAEYGRWNGVYPHGNQAVLAYSVGTTDVHEIPGSILTESGHIFTRTVTVGASTDLLYLNAAEVSGVQAGKIEDGVAYIRHKAESDTVTAVAVKSEDGKVYPVHVVGNQFLSVEFPVALEQRTVTVFLWRGSLSAVEGFRDVVRDHTQASLLFEKGGPLRWKEKVLTKGQLAPDTAAFVIDLLTLPLPNPWQRDMRAADIAFLSGSKAAVVTLSGDVWLVEGISDKLNQLEWTRYASGLFEPTSIEVRDGEIFVFGKEGIVKLVDLNNDGQADFYENFSNCMDQSIESREWATDLVLAPDGGFYISKGGTAIGGPGVTPTVTPGFRAGSNHSGTVIKVSSDGRQAEVIASGLRVPYLGIRPGDGLLSATDQQGNFVPSTPVYLVEPGAYFGVPATRHSDENLEIKRPLAWIPHRVDRSASGQLWVTGGKMGPLNNAYLHLSFGRPGVFKVLVDTTATGLQGGVVFVPASYVAPTLKGAVGPSDGQVYLAGLNMFGSNSLGITAIQRLRYTGQPSYSQAGFEAGREGIILSFDCELDEAVATDHALYQVKRWNYKRTDQYGSGHYKYDGSAGEDVLPVLAAHLSADRRQVLLLVPDMKAIDQVEVLYNIAARDGKPINDGFWFSLQDTGDLNIAEQGFRNVDLGMLDLTREEIAAMIKSDLPVTVERGKELFAKTGCLGCHSTGLKTDGMYGPPFRGLYGSKVELSDGTFITVDDVYLRESILEPSKKVVKGYEPQMPSYHGVLSESDIQSIIFYIKTLYR